MLGIYLHNIFSKLGIFFSILYKCMDERPNAIKKGVGQIGNMAARSKRKFKEKMAKSDLDFKQIGEDVNRNLFSSS